jgi:hypothetical protein
VAVIGNISPIERKSRVAKPGILQIVPEELLNRGRGCLGQTEMENAFAHRLEIYQFESTRAIRNTESRIFGLNHHRERHF